MHRIQQIVEKRDWRVRIEVDPNEGGDGTRVCFYGDPHSFRMLAEIFTSMAETVDNPEHPAAQTGWHLAFNPEYLPQLEIKNASFLTLNCSPSEAG